MRRFRRLVDAYLRRCGPIVETFLFQAAYKLPSVLLENIVSPETQINELILMDACLPPYWGSNEHDDLQPLMKIVRTLQPRIVVELGTAHGNIVANICQQCPTTKIYTVNALPDDQTGIEITYELSPAEIGRVYRTCGFTDRVTQIFKNTLELDLSDYLKDPIVDLAIIDACHDTAYVMNDFMKVVPFMSEHGIILLHDTDPHLKEQIVHIETQGHLLGSYLACLKLRKQGFDVRHIVGTWWAIWSQAFPVIKEEGQPVL